MLSASSCNYLGMQYWQGTLAHTPNTDGQSTGFKTSCHQNLLTVCEGLRFKFYMVYHVCTKNRWFPCVALSLDGDVTRN